jgi:hypothetical protein
MANIFEPGCNDSRLSQMGDFCENSDVPSTSIRTGHILTSQSSINFL